MCPAAYKLAFMVTAWCFNSGEWLDVSFCLPKNESKIGSAYIETTTGLKSVSVEVTTVKNKTIFVLNRCGNEASKMAE